MHLCQALLDKAFSLARREAEALELDDADGAVELSQERADILGQAWKERQGFDERLLKEKLANMAALQDDLIRRATALQKNLRENLGLRKKQEGYFKDSRKRLAESQKAFYLSKRS